jgi:hypothetical protein
MTCVYSVIMAALWRIFTIVIAAMMVVILLFLRIRFARGNGLLLPGRDPG